MKYRAYRTKSDNRFHFQFTTDGGEAVLNGGPYDEKEACFDGIRAVMTAASNPSNYTQETTDGKTYFIISSGGNELTRSEGYASVEAANSAASLTQKEGPTATAKGAADSSGGAKKATTSSSTTSDDYKPLAFYESRISGVKDGFEKFADEGEYYFTYNMDGLVVMISEGYSSDTSRDNGIASVTKNMVIADRYQQKVHSNGKSFFDLKAGNHQEIATSRWFEGDGDRDAAIGLLTSGGKGGGKLSAMFSTKKSSGAIYPDYKALNFYQERIEGTPFGYDSFSEGDHHYFTINQESTPLLISETYQSEGARDKGIASVKKNVKKENRYVSEQHPNGKYYFRLLAGNKQEIATSIWFDSAKDRDKAITWLLGTGGTRRRKKAARTKEVGERVYVNQGLSFPCSDITYDTFQSGGNKKYYFVFKDRDEKAILINGDVRGYENPEAAAEAIKRVFKYAPDPKNYLRKVSKTGKHYFFVKDENDKSVARGSLFYGEKEAMETTIKMIACGAGIGGASKAAAAAPASDKVVDDYMPCEAYTGAEGFHTFFNEERKEYYFGFNNGSGVTYLRSEGYTSEAGRNNGIESVKKNAPNDARWGTATALNDKYHYYYLRAGNNQEIARSCYYKSAAEMQAAYEWVRGGDSIIGKGAGLYQGAWMTANAISAQEAANKAAAAPAPAAPSSDKVVDDYLPCEAYAGEEGFHTFFNEERKEHYFGFNHGDKTYLRSEGYTSSAGRDNGIESVKKNAPIDARWSTATALNDKYHYYCLKAGNNQEIARSCYYKDEAAMLADFAWVQGGDSIIGKGAAMFAGAWMTGNAISSKKDADAAAKLKADEAEKARLAAEAEAKRKADEAEKARLAAEAEAKRKADEAEKARLAAEEAEAKRLVQEREKARMAKAAEEKRLAAEAEKARLMEEAKLKAAADAEKTKAAAAAAAAAAALAAKSKSVEDDYLPCEDYSGEEGFHTFKHEDSGEFYFAFNDDSGKTFLRSEGYTTSKARDNGIESVKKNAPIEERWSTGTALNEKYHYYILKAGNNKEIARSCYYKDKAAMLAAMGWARGSGSGISKWIGAGALGAAAIAAIPKAVPTPVTPPPPKKKVVAAAAPVAAAAATSGGMGWLKWLIPLLLLLALAFFLMKGCDGCGDKAAVVAAVDDVNENVAPPPPPAPKAPLCSDGAALGLTPNSTSFMMADFLSDPNHTFPKSFTADKITFSRGSTRLNTAARKQLDNIVTVMKECGAANNSRLDIAGFISGEKGTYRGSKEISLDDVRAREAYDYLKKRGIDESRMNFSGGGDGDSRTLEFTLRQ